MDEVQTYLAATNQVPIPHKYFVRPIYRSLALGVGPPTAKQKFFRRQTQEDLPVRTWLKHFDSALPQPSTQLGIERSTYSPTGDMFGRLLPTTTLKSGTKKYEVNLPPGRIGAIEDFFSEALAAQYKKGATGCSRVARVSKERAKSGARARYMSTVVGPISIRHAHTTIIPTFPLSQPFRSPHAPAPAFGTLSEYVGWP